MTYRYVMVLSDGQTYADLEGSAIVAIPEETEGDDLDLRVENLEAPITKLWEFGKLPETTDELFGSINLFLPRAVIGQDNDGQLVIYTGLAEGSGGELRMTDPGAF